MNKRILILLLAAALLCTLWGCACEHQWQPADCTTPQTCAECGETQGDALGHTWQAATCLTPETCEVCGATQGEVAGHNWEEATCTAPKTCKVCGLTEGEALPHDYQLHSFSGDTMRLRCQLCSDTITEPIDRELYLQSRMSRAVGHWDLFAVKKGTTTTSAVKISGVGPYLTIAEDGTMHLHLENGDVLDLTWQFVEYQQVDNSGVYSCNFVNSANETQYPATITESSGELEIAVTLPDNRTVIFQRNEPLEKFLTGTWSCFTEEQLYTMELNSDRTFTANLEGGVSGTWHISPIYVANYGMNFDVINLTLSYTLDGNPKVCSSYVILADEGKASSVLNGNGTSIASFEWKDSKANKQIFLWSPGFYPGEHTIVAEDVNTIVGNWVTSEVITYSYATRSSTTEETSEFTAVFNEDGTFEINTTKTTTGDWHYICTSNDNGSICYRYTLEILGYTPITLYVQGDSLVWSFYESAGGYDGSDYMFHWAE